MGLGAGHQLHPVAVLGISRLLRSRDWLRPGLRPQEGDKEGGRLRGFAQGCRKAPGCTSGIAVVVEVEVGLRIAGKASEGIDGAGGQWGGAAALVSATGVSEARDYSLPRVNQVDASPNLIVGEHLPTALSRCSGSIDHNKGG